MIWLLIGEVMSAFHELTISWPVAASLFAVFASFGRLRSDQEEALQKE